MIGVRQLLHARDLIAGVIEELRELEQAKVHDASLIAQAVQQLRGSPLADQPAKASSVLFSEFSQLLGLGEQIGLTSGTRVRELLPDLTKVRAIGLSSTSGESDTTTELRLEIP